MSRILNFSAGPSTLPVPVLQKAAEEMVDYRGAGLSVMEMSHRSPVYQDIFDGAEAHLRELMQIPDNYKVLFLQGGASCQFAMVPMNLFSSSNKADFVNTGVWSKKAIAEAKRYGDINIVASSEDKNFSYIPKLDPSAFNSNADYFHITSNNTIYGTCFNELPDTGSVPIVADMSIVIIREDLIGNAMDITPTMLNYQTHADNGSMFNTPPCYSIYIAKLVFEWLKNLGGLEAIEKINREKAALLYDYIDESNAFSAPVVKEDRSLMNVPFILPSEELNAKFLKEASENGVVNLKGHRSVGGMRASIYNAMPKENVATLVDFMKKFEQANC
jgi:phosphoserine aminotransferase